MSVKNRLSSTMLSTYRSPSWIYPTIVAAMFLAFATLAACANTVDDDVAVDDTDTTEEPAGTADDASDDHADDASDDHAHSNDDDDSTSESEEVGEPAYRLLISDGEEGTISVVDVGADEVIATSEAEVPATSPNMLSRTSDGRYGLVVMYGGDAVDAIDVGTWATDHGDHAHYYIAPPETLQRYPGGQPAHVVSRGDSTAIFYDEDGEYRMLERSEIAEGEEGRLIPTDAPHHGVAIPWDEDRTLVSLFGELDPNETTLPAEIVVHDAEGEIIEDGFPKCPELHGEAVLGDTASFACSDGILVLEEHGDHFHGHKIDYPDDDDDARSGTLVAVDGVDVLIGNYSPDSFVIIDPIEQTIDLLEIPEPFSTFDLSSHDGGSLLGISPSGDLHVIDVLSGNIESIEDVTGPYDEDAEWTDPTPQVAAGPGSLVFATEPDTGQVHEIDLETGEATWSFDIPGVPFHLTVLGPSS